MRILKYVICCLLVIFILPALASLAIWQADKSKPANWRQANWSSAGILPEASQQPEAAVYVMAARTGRWKGAFSVHSWLVTKRAGSDHYDRYDVVGWGRPVRKNAYSADARWYSNLPEILHEVHGERAMDLIEQIEHAVSAYPQSDYGDYQIWPGPNSNSFVSFVLNEVPELGYALPANAIGKDWLGADRWFAIDPDYQNVQVSIGGYAGFAFGKRHGIEVNILGLVAGLDLQEPALKLPGFGRITF